MFRNLQVLSYHNSLFYSTTSTVNMIVHLFCAVQLWTTGNYHWYLKQELRLPPAKDATGRGGSTGLVGMIWDPIAPLTLHLLTKGK